MLQSADMLHECTYCLYSCLIDVLLLLCFIPEAASAARPRGCTKVMLYRIFRPALLLLHCDNPAA
jgi:hypothetical protein